MPNSGRFLRTAKAIVSSAISLPDAARRPKIVLYVWLTTAALIFLLAAFLYKDRAESEQRTAEEAATVARMTANRVALTLENTDSLLKVLQNDVYSLSDDGNPDRVALTATLQRSLLVSPGLASLSLLDRDGNLVASSSRDGTIAPGTAQAFALLGQTGNSPLISRAMIDPVTRLWGMTLARALLDSDGALQGALLAQIEINRSFARSARGLGSGDRDLLVLRQANNALLAEVPASGDMLATDHQLMTTVQGGPTSGVTVSTGTLDGITRLVAFQKLPDYGLQVVYARDIEDALTDWWWDIGIAILAALVGIASGTFVTLSVRRMTIMTEQLETVRGHLKQSNHALREALATSEMMAAKDQLTGLWNRRTFDLRLDQAVARRIRHKGCFALLLIDMDNFKAVNDAYGHATGDEVLKRFAFILHERLRQNDVAARWGGEEFAVLADGARLEQAFALAEQVRQAVESASFAPVPRLTVSIGLAEHQGDENREQLFGRADRALYEAKRAGRNCVIAASHHSAGPAYLSTGPGESELFGATERDSA